jgi:hypothetical protein
METFGMVLAQAVVEAPVLLAQALPEALAILQVVRQLGLVEQAVLEIMVQLSAPMEGQLQQ